MARRGSRRVAGSLYPRARAPWWPSSESSLPRDLVVRRSYPALPTFSGLFEELAPVERRGVLRKALPYSLPAKRVVSPRGVMARDMRSLAFARPDLVLTCLRRKVRREVLHALKLSGRGAGGTHRVYRRTVNSEISC